MKFPSLRTISLATLVVLAAIGVAVGQTGMDQLVTAAKQEGQLTTIALPHDWCGYGELIASYKTKYGIKVNELNPDAGSGDEIEAIKANKGNKGPQAPDVIDVGLSFGPSAKKEGLPDASQGRHLGHDPRTTRRTPRATGTATTTACSPSRSTPTSSRTCPPDWADLLKPEYKNAVALAGDPRTSNQAIQGVLAAGLAMAKRQHGPGGRGRPEVLRRPQQGRQLRAGHRQGGLPSPGRHARSSSAGTTTRSPTATR